MRRIFKSKENKVLSGLIGGLGEFLEVDPVLLRLIWIGVTALTGFVPGIIAYIVAVAIVPLKTD